MRRFVRIALVVLSSACAGDFIDDGLPTEGVDEIRGGGYNCHPDKKVDQAAQLVAVEALGSTTVHATAVSGSDASGNVTVHAYQFVDPSGAAVLASPQVIPNCPYGDNPNNIYAEPLVPGTTYQVTALSRDACGNPGTSSPLSLTMPPLGDDATPPTTTTPRIGWGAMLSSLVPYIHVYATDASGIDRVEFFADGVAIGKSEYTSMHVWSNQLGETYWRWMASQYRGRTIAFRADVYDNMGNLTSTEATVAVP